jgi:hypothetical protein
MIANTLETGHEFVEQGKESLKQVRRDAKGLAEAGRNAVNEIKDELVAPSS